MICGKRIAAFLAALGLPLAALAHHSWSAVYDGGEEVTIEATIVSEPFRNPHNAVHVEIENADGELEPWTVEWRGGRRRDGEPPVSYDLSPGDAVVIEGRIARFPGSKKLQMYALTRPADGMRIEASRGRGGQR